MSGPRERKAARFAGEAATLRATTMAPGAAGAVIDGGAPGPAVDGAAAAASPHAIPRDVHQIWLGPRPVPTRYTEYRATVLRHHPPERGWRCTLWRDADAERLVAERCPWLLPTWRAYQTLVQRVDALKHVLMAELGGFYVDMDAQCLKPLDALLKAHPRATFLAARFDDASWVRAASAVSGLDLYANNHFMASAPGDPFAVRVLGDLPDALARYRGPRWAALRVLRTTGPDFLSRHVRRALAADPPPGSVIAVVPKRTIEAHSAQAAGPDALIVHHSDLTWMPVIGPVVTGCRRAARAPGLLTLVLLGLSALLMLALAASVRRGSLRAAELACCAMRPPVLSVSSR